MSVARPKLAFISPVFLFPADAGGKIRSGNILRGLVGGNFDVTLASPATVEQQAQWQTQLDGLCDRFVRWQPDAPKSRWRRALSLWLTTLPVNVAADRTKAALAAVETLLGGERFDVVVFDFVHSAVLRPHAIEAATVCFTHNVEAEIFARHALQANRLMRGVWKSQHVKMHSFEARALQTFTRVIAVSQRDADQFQRSMGVDAVAIPTGVDLDFFRWCEPAALEDYITPTIVFTGSMDWEANIDGVNFFLAEVWPLVLAQVPTARFVVVGRRPPVALVERTKADGSLDVTGFVDDVRPHVQAAHVFVIPLRVGGGTRIKAFEAMAMGCPVVSTSIGIEGLDVVAGEHFLLSDSPGGFAEAVVSLLREPELRAHVSRRARSRVEARFGHQVAARAFEHICVQAVTAYAAETGQHLSSGTRSTTSGSHS